MRGIPVKKTNFVQTVLSVASCKLTRAMLRKTGRGGTAIPGLVAMKVSSRILTAVSEGMKLIVVTGTNGKTTTCNMIEHALTSGGHNCLRDKSGANMLHGIAADLISNATWNGRPKYEYAVLECDEAALKLLVNYVTPSVIVVTNLFSDQVDRYGGVENTKKEIRTGIERSPESVLVLNAEDPLSSSLSLHLPNRVIRYGLNETVGTQGNVDLSDAGVCPECGNSYEYDYHIYADLGGFRCPKCGYKRQDPDIAVLSVDQKTSNGSTIHLKVGEGVQKVQIALPAVYNIYNAAAAIAAVKALSLPLQEAIDSLSSVHSAFGRLETFDLHGIRLQMILVKNPAGCNQAFSYVTGLDEDFTAVLCLNNRTGDGHDFSWIENTDYEKLCSDPHLKQIYIAGDCAKELYTRLKKAGADESSTEIITDYNGLVKRLQDDGRTAFLLPNYTSMMELRQALSPETGNQDFWK